MIYHHDGLIPLFLGYVLQVWVPFCRKHQIEPRNPDAYFNLKTDPTKNKKRHDFVKDRRWIKREYDEFKVRINGLPEVIRKRSEMYNSREEAREKQIAREKNGGTLPADESVNVTKATWMADGTHWPGTWHNSTADHAKGDHAGILQVLNINATLLFECELSKEDNKNTHLIMFCKAQTF